MELTLENLILVLRKLYPYDIEFAENTKLRTVLMASMPSLSWRKLQTHLM